MPIALAPVKRRTVSLSDEALATLERLARAHRSNVSCVIEAAAGAIETVGAVAQAVEVRIGPDRRGGKRERAGRKPTVDQSRRKAP